MMILEEINLLLTEITKSKPRFFSGQSFMLWGFSLPSLISSSSCSTSEAGCELCVFSPGAFSLREEFDLLTSMEIRARPLLSN